INMDADSPFWEPMPVPVIKGKIANSNGIEGLVREISDLDYIVYDTPGEYIKTHEPLGDIDFTHDTADGNFTGYASWAEKPYNRKIWTAIDRARAMAKVNAKSDFDAPSFRDRVLLLSTTHFGLATPVLNIQREIKANELADKIITQESAALDVNKKLTLHNITKSTLQCVQLKLNIDVDSASQIKLKASNLADYTVIPMDDDISSVFVIMRFKKVQSKYTVDVSVDKKKDSKPLDIGLKTDTLEIKFSVHGNIYSVLANGREIGESEFLKSFVTYDGKRYEFEKTDVTPLELGGSGEGLRVSGVINLPNQTEQGNFAFDFFKIKSSDAIFVRTNVNYPYTPETTSISTENSSLGRFSDMKWTEAVPFQITPNLDGDIRVIKRNFMDDISTFRTQSFPECDEKNKSLASFNHQLTAGVVGLADENGGLIIANARQVLGAMAQCPMRLDEDKTVHMNPFGHYYGNQRHHWGRAKDEILATYTMITPQGKSIGPAYNGNGETAMLALFGFSGSEPTDEQMSDIIAFADGAVATDNEAGVLTPFYGDNVRIKEAKADGIEENQLINSVWSGLAGNIKDYATKGSKAVFHIIKSQLKSRK
ncbi:MAG: hypothetical protein IJ643_06930, partial [Eubacterium sp.]|nr:hypothetical protein [Eubacterium sp.]